jgi:transporter family-2 protein
MFFYLLVALSSGVSIVLARIINADLAKRIGIVQGTFWNFLSGFILSVLLVLMSGGFGQFSWVQLAKVPGWAYTGGLIGIAVIMLSSFLTPRVSAFYLTLLVFVSQLFVGLLIDFFILNEFPYGIAIGGVLVLSGLSFNLWLDAQKSS